MMSAGSINPYADSAAIVWQYPSFSFVDKSAICRLAQRILQEKLEIPSWRTPIFPERDDEVFIQFLGVANAINFCFTEFNSEQKYDVMYRDKMWYGADAMIAALHRATNDGFDILNPKFLARLTAGEAETIFIHYNTTPIPMFIDRVQQLNALGNDMMNNGIMHFADLFKECDYYLFRDGEGIVERLATRFASYRDSAFFHGTMIQFAKRAQLFPMLYHGRAVSSGGKLQPIRDPEHFGPVVDYQIPRALRDQGVLEYGRLLARLVDEGLPIERESPMEIELRAQTVYAMTLLLHEINRIRKEHITMVELDSTMWYLGRKSKKRHHYTYTTAY